MGDRVLILGGTGFIGRHLVMYLYKNKLASKVCVADKVLYQIAGLNKEELAVYDNKDFVTFKQADMANPGAMLLPRHCGPSVADFTIGPCLARP